MPSRKDEEDFRSRLEQAPAQSAAMRLKVAEHGIVDTQAKLAALKQAGDADEPDEKVGPEGHQALAAPTPTPNSCDGAIDCAGPGESRRRAAPGGSNVFRGFVDLDADLATAAGGALIGAGTWG
jgi:hypothetical protein